MKLIDKAAVVAEIEILKSEYLKHTMNKFYAKWSCGTLDNILSFLDTLEVKEVDLEKELNNFIEQQKAFVKDDRVVEYNNGDTFNHIYDLEDIAKHFFELGLRSTITEGDCKLIWNIGDEIPNMPEEEFFKELLKRFKAQKGEDV